MSAIQKLNDRIKQNSLRHTGGEQIRAYRVGRWCSFRETRYSGTRLDALRKPGRPAVAASGA